LYIPMLAEGADNPPANNISSEENDETDSGEQRKKRAVQKHHFQSGSQDHAGMDHDHGAKDRIGDLRGAVGDHFALVEAGKMQFVKTQKRYDKQEAEIGFNT